MDYDMPRIQTVIFDISGVLVELSGMPDFEKWTGMSPKDISTQWLMSESVRSLESGKIDFATFHDRFLTEWEIEISHEDLKQAFEDWVSKAFDGAADLVMSLDDSLQLACLANTNEVQWPVVCDTLDIDSLFPRQFASHIVGMVKPDAEIYHHALAELSATPESTLFIDDSSLNVAAAKEIGINAYCVKGPSEARAVLENFDLLKS